MNIPRQHDPSHRYRLEFDTTPPNPTPTDTTPRPDTASETGTTANDHERPRRARRDDVRQDDAHHDDARRDDAGRHSAGAGAGQTVLRVTEPGQLLTAIAFGLGYQPTEPSLLVVGIAHRQMVSAARLEVPPMADLPPGGLPGLWEAFVPFLTATGVEDVIIVGYLDRSWVPQLRRFSDTAPLIAMDLLRVHDGRWWSLNCLDGGCTHPGCSYPGAVLTEDCEIAATMVAHGRPVPGTREDLAAALHPGPTDLLTAVRAHLEDLTRRPRPTRRALHDALRDARDARTDGPVPLPPDQAAVLLHALTDPLVRDHCITWTDPAAWWLWHDLIRTAPPGTIAPVATLIAIAAYAKGAGTQTRIALDTALADNPHYPLARLIDQCLRVGLTPDTIRDTVTTTTLALAVLPDDDPTPDRHPDDAQPDDEQSDEEPDDGQTHDGPVDGGQSEGPADPTP